jgi:hypothetical protein
MRLNVNNVNWVKQQRLKVPLIAILVMLERLAKPTVCVRPARLVCIKTTKAKQNASNATLGNRTSMKKQPVVIATKVHLAVAPVIVRAAHLGLTKTPKEKQRAILLLLAHPEKYPTTNVPGVNCRHGVPAKQENI